MGEYNTTFEAAVTSATPTYRSAFRPNLFLGQTIIVTGGGSGIGRCTAHELASLGARVVLVGRNLEKLQNVQTEIAQAGGDCAFRQVDIRDEDGVTAMVASVVSEFGRVHALVNNAGGQYMTPLEDISLKGWQAVVNSNLTGGFLMARECFRQTMKEHGGVIINIVADFWGSMPSMGHSGAARAGMVSFTETAALEWARYGIRENAVAPGYIASSGMDHYPPEAGDRIRKNGSTVPLGRMGNEAETSAAIVFLLSPAANFITGAVSRVDGGRPQTRNNWAGEHANASVHNREAVKPFDGFLLYKIPNVLNPK